jgi:hypothetical protein
MNNDLTNVKSTPIEEDRNNEEARTVEYWRKNKFIRGMDNKIFEMVVFEKGLEERDRLTLSQIETLMAMRKNKIIG